MHGGRRRMAYTQLLLKGGGNGVVCTHQLLKLLASHAPFPEKIPRTWAELVWKWNSHFRILKPTLRGQYQQDSSESAQELLQQREPLPNDFHASLKPIVEPCNSTCCDSLDSARTEALKARNSRSPSGQGRGSSTNVRIFARCRLWLCWKIIDWSTQTVIWQAQAADRQ